MVISTLPRPFVLGVLSRVVVLCWAMITSNLGIPYDSSQSLTPRPPTPPPTHHYPHPCMERESCFLDPGLLRLLGPLSNWDGVYFIHLAGPWGGYWHEQFHAFLPGYPFLCHALRTTLLHPLEAFGLASPRPTLILAGVLLNLVAFGLAAWALEGLTHRVVPSLARASTLAMCATPGGVFFTAVYTESTFAAATFGGLWALEEGVAGATRAGLEEGGYHLQNWGMWGTLWGVNRGSTSSKEGGRGENTKVNGGNGDSSSGNDLADTPRASPTASFTSPGTLPPLLYLVFGAALLTVASTIRSNGVLGVGYVVWGVARLGVVLGGSNLLSNNSSYRGLCVGRAWGRWCTTVPIPSLLLIYAIPACIAPLLPLPAFSAWAASRYCTSLSGGDNEPNSSNKTPPAWCPISDGHGKSGGFSWGGGSALYPHVQSVYWGVGFLSRWSLSQAPQFALAAPMLVLWCGAVWGWWGRLRSKVWGRRQEEQREQEDEQVQEQEGQQQQQQKGQKQLEGYTLWEGVDRGLRKALKRRGLGLGEEGRTLPYLIHWGLLCTVGVLVSHPQVLTRMAASACPAVYWAIARGWVEGGWGVRAAITLWCVGYTAFGTALFVNFHNYT